MAHLQSQNLGGGNKEVVGQAGFLYYLNQWVLNTLGHPTWKEDVLDDIRLSHTHPQGGRKSIKKYENVQLDIFSVIHTILPFQLLSFNCGSLTNRISVYKMKRSWKEEKEDWDIRNEGQKQRYCFRSQQSLERVRETAGS